MTERVYIPHEDRIYERPVDILRQLIRFDTTNPPGNEYACIMYIRQLLEQQHIDSQIFALHPDRPNLVARLKGRGQAPPLLLYGHVDVVGTASQQWTHPPFEGRIVDGQVWGRGALDMKGGVAQMLSAFMRAKAEQTDLPGDVVLAIVSDEEAGAEYGAQFLIDKHAGLFQDVRYAIGEFGGFSMQMGKQRFYPIMVAEKQLCWFRTVFHGDGGHGSLPAYGGSMTKLGVFLNKLSGSRLPVHITPAAREMIHAMGSAMPFPAGHLFKQVLNPRLTNMVLHQLGSRRHSIEPLLRHTVNPTIVHGGEKINVTPSEITLELDGRLLPGYQPEDLFTELNRLMGQTLEYEIIRYTPGPPKPDMGLFPTLQNILVEEDPEGIPVPMLLPGGTDAMHFSKLGIQTYGFLPMRLPEDMKFTELIHSANERIPVDAVHFGARAIHKVLQRFS
ncbi:MULTISPECIES: M20/M25/M40 family metallo-hydrolase [Paenibacillus]|uniref:M20/M25/M40 family metallo-hydrolase n=1 Tax=Paenibacillus TaxID=44249 RepID=UPI0022B88FC3|nr:M20/M25/M40 family metallo-hydrolase [Paenibacillus caseinilyticus]MCZ8518251.1 M20/M25/M40 family metallo-hydrolase [Paenibacillus caseinilyticus]